MAARTRALPSQRRRGLGIVRVSREGGRGDRLLSPELQRNSILDYAKRKNIRVVDWLEAVDESGSRARSAWWPRLDAAIGRVEAGDIDVIVAWEFSRAARNRLRWNVAIDRVETAGGALESSTEDIDASTAAGRFQRGMLAEMHAYRAEATGESWKAVHKHRTDRGLPANGKARFGYRLDTELRLHVPDEETGPVLKECYRRYVSGESIYSLVQWLNDLGVLTVGGYQRYGPGPWSDRSLRRVMDNGFAAGFITVGGDLRPGAHEPLISRDVWDAYQVVRADRRVVRSSERSQYLLSGMLRCYHVMPDGSACGSSMTAGQFGDGRMAKYRCKGVAQRRKHTGGYVLAKFVEGAVVDWLQSVADEVDDASAQAPAPPASETSGALQRRVEAAHARLLTATRRLVDGVIPEEAYKVVRAEIEEELVRLEERARMARVAAQRPAAAVAAADLLADWSDLAVDVRRATLRELIARVEVVPGRPRGIVTVVPAWAGDDRT